MKQELVKELTEIVQGLKCSFTKTARVYCAYEGGGIFCGIDFECVDGDVLEGTTIFAVPPEERPNIKDWEDAVSIAHTLGNVAGLPVEFGELFITPYQEMYFYLDSDYKHGRGYSSPEAGEAFHSEINRLFTEAGWEIRPGGGSGSCDSAVKGKQDLYLHPMMVSGVMLKEEVGAVEQILRNGTTFRLREIRGFDEYQDMEDDTYRAWLESKHDEIEAAILERYRTKRRNLYITGYTTSSIAKLFEIKRVQSAHKSGDMAEGYVGQLIQELIESGRLVTAETRHGPGIRTATASELAQPLPGQQAMGGMSGPC